MRNVILFILVAANAATSKSEEVDPAILAEGTWKVKDKIENGSAFPVFENYFLTAGHVVEHNGSIHGFTLQNLMNPAPNRHYTGVSGKVIYIGCEKYEPNGICPKGDDVALIESDLPKNEDIVRFDVSFEARFRYPFRGSSVGYPIGSEFSVFSEGQFSILDISQNREVGRNFKNGELYYLGNSASASGESGGPVFLRNSDHKIVSLISLNTAPIVRSATTFTINNMALVRAVSKIPTPVYLKNEIQAWLNNEALDKVKDRLGKYSNIELFLLANYVIDNIDSSELRKPSQKYLRSVFDLLISRKIDYVVMDFKQKIELEASSDINRDVGKVASRLADYYKLTGNNDEAKRLYAVAVEYMSIFIDSKPHVIASNNAILNDVVDQMTIAYDGLDMESKKLSWIAFGASRGLPSQIEQMAKIAYRNNDYSDAALYYTAAYETYSKELKQVPNYVVSGLELSLKKSGEFVFDPTNGFPTHKPEALQIKLESFISNLDGAQEVNKLFH